ncbi:MAG: tetratricopeptide repeat protein [Treponema sp.]|jgi:tetratricopeptide (TPR) repeat protein|nr:tetratricopeptide repeat protein [Treponema sp.]
MSGILPIAAIVVILGISAVFMMMMGRSKGGETGGGRKKRSKGRDVILKDANKRLAQNPRDPEALSALADLYYQEEAWDKAFKNYELLTETARSNQNINEFEVHLRYALSAMKLGMVNEAYRGFTLARNFRQDNFEVNFNLGTLEFQKKNYEKAIQLLQAARAQDPENAAVLRCLGHSFFRLKRHKEAKDFIQKAINMAPDDKESFYTLAECYYEANQIEQALRIFGHLRPDPVMGASASLFSGTINMERHQYERAIQDFEIGLKHENIKPEVLVDLRYRLATAYLKQNNIGKAIPLLKDIQLTNPSGYKDVAILIGKYQELNANKNLQIFMMAPSADFVALCRKIVITYYARARVKITNISVNKNEWADILAEIDTPKWSDVVMFRFIRSPGSVGELILRDFHSHLKEVKAGKGICISVGAYTDEAKRYTEARLIDLIDKERLTAILNTVDSKAQAVSATKKTRG